MRWSLQWNLKIIKVIRMHPGIINTDTKCHGNQTRSWWASSVWLKVLANGQPDIICCSHAGWRRWMPSKSHYLTSAADELESTETTFCFAECVVSRSAVSTVADILPLTLWQLWCHCVQSFLLWSVAVKVDFVESWHYEAPDAAAAGVQ